MRARLSLGLALAALAAGAPPAAGAESVLDVRGHDDPATPDRLDRVRVLRFGPESARRVLVLVPGSHAGAGAFTPVARDLVRRVPRLQVWALDRRSNRLEDTSRFRPGTSLAEATDYYAGLRFRRPSAAPYARRWGLRVALEDLRRVVRAARRGGRAVTLGGHSLGASVAAAYAAWDFGGRPGHRDVDGLMLIDGGLLGAFGGAGLLEARRRQAEIEAGEPFDALLPGLPPPAAGVLAQLGAMHARLAPDAPSALQDHPLLPRAFAPPVPVTNEALLGYAFDRDTSPRAYRALWVRAGGLAAAGNPRPWSDRGAAVPVQRLARTLDQEPVNAIEWYSPRRLALDVEAASAMRTTRAGLLLGLRLRHLRTIDDPLYAYQSNFTRGRVLRAARRLFAASRSPRAFYLHDRGAAHNDPLWARPAANHFLRTAVPFLRRLG